MAAKKDAVKQQIQQETALTQAQELMNNSTEKCFARCIVTPGTDLSNKDKACLSTCFDKYLQTFNVVSRTYTARLARTRHEEHSATLS
ncbi:Tim10/DDP family zinc finger-domain-containing protein [Coprinopsis sp. MPI-PUGE-AT-0042]|nr:Tim10/DDP family zinc finger-domain-containing protein [Coprinopsis sp. MPI-PUGE-AT-0042]